MPSATLVVKLGCIARHVEELLSIHGHDLDRVALIALLEDTEVVAWMQRADEAALLPLFRNA